MCLRREQLVVFKNFQALRLLINVNRNAALQRKGMEIATFLPIASSEMLLKVSKIYGRYEIDANGIGLRPWRWALFVVVVGFYLNFSIHLFSASTAH
jgi:hypothetical protein